MPMSNTNYAPDRTEQGPETVVVTLRDFSQVKKYLTYETVSCLFRDVTPENYISRFCSEVQALVRKANAEDIFLLNSNASGDEEDDEEPDNKLTLFTMVGGSMCTQKYVGVLKIDIPTEKTPDEQPRQLILNIRSRFDGDDQSYFLLYVFEQAMGSRGKIFNDMELLASEVEIWDLLLLTAFVNQLHDAMKKGFFRQYHDREHNDDRIKGRIDIARHIRMNFPFTGKIAYSSREYDADNPVNILILRALNYLDRRYHSLLQRLINRDSLLRQGITLLKNEAPGWKNVSDHIAMQNARRKIAHSVYRDYEPLRKTALAVLNQMGASSFRSTNGSDPEQRPYRVSGILIDMPKLWEEFLHNVIFREYSGDSDKYHQRKLGIIGGKRFAEPDFLLREQGIVLDAKYKAHWGNTMTTPPKTETGKSSSGWAYLRDDTYQVISYALIFDCVYCGVIFPLAKGAPHDDAKDPLEVPISKYCQDRFFVRLPYYIPTSADNEAAYRKAFDASNQDLIDRLRELEQKARAYREEPL